MTVVRMCDRVQDGNRITWILLFLAGIIRDVEHLTEGHEFGLFTQSEVRAAFAVAGIEVTCDGEGLMGRWIDGPVALCRVLP